MDQVRFPRYGFIIFYDHCPVGRILMKALFMIHGHPACMTDFLSLGETNVKNSCLSDFIKQLFWAPACWGKQGIPEFLLGSLPSLVVWDVLGFTGSRSMRSASSYCWDWDWEMSDLQRLLPSLLLPGWNVHPWVKASLLADLLSHLEVLEMPLLGTPRLLSTKTKFLAWSGETFWEDYCKGRKKLLQWREMELLQ